MNWLEFLSVCEEKYGKPATHYLSIGDGTPELVAWKQDSNSIVAAVRRQSLTSEWVSGVGVAFQSLTEMTRLDMEKRRCRRHLNSVLTQE